MSKKLKAGGGFSVMARAKYDGWRVNYFPLTNRIALASLARKEGSPMRDRGLKGGYGAAQGACTQIRRKNGRIDAIIVNSRPLARHTVLPVK